MGRFYFRMESILNVREKIEEQKAGIFKCLK